MSSTILVVDDEPGIRRVLVSYLRANSYDTLEAADGRAALAEFRTGAPDLVLLDIGLPDIDGLEVLRQMRMVADVPTILVTARAEEMDTIIGLSVGADDYITKPFSPREVVARVSAVLRRRPAPVAAGVGAPDVLAFAGLVIDPRRREVLLEGRGVQFSALEFDLLHALATEPGRVFSRAQLLEKVWGSDFFGDERVVDVHIRSIRRALGDPADEPGFIATVRSVGYRFVGRPERTR